MRMMIAALAAAGMLTLVGCSAPAEGDVEPSKKPSAETSADADPADPGWTAPEECSSLDLNVGATLAGSALGECVAQSLVSFGSGRETVQTSTNTSEVAFRYDPDFEMQGETKTTDGSMRLTYVDGTMWVDDGSGPVKGDVDSDDMDEMLAGLTGEMIRIFADPAMTADMVARGAEWVVGEQVDVELGNGETVRAFPIDVAAPYTWNEMPVQEHVVWFAEGWVPVGGRGTVATMGMTETTTQTYYDLGEPVEITPPVG